MIESLPQIKAETLQRMRVGETAVFDGQGTFAAQKLTSLVSRYGGKFSGRFVALFDPTDYSSVRVLLVTCQEILGRGLKK